MGQVSLQRSNLTVNHGSYYIDTTLTKSQQNSANPNVFKAGQTYYVFFIYATPGFHQTYSMYIGKVSQSAGEAAVQPARVVANSLAFGLSQVSGNWITSKNYDRDTGLLTVTVDLNGQTEFDTDRSKFCQPASYCTYDSKTSTCGCNPKNSACKPADNVCSWGVKDIDCPIKGCFGFAVTMQADPSAPGSPAPPAPILFTSDSYFDKGNVTFGTVSNGECTYPSPPEQQ